MTFFAFSATRFEWGADGYVHTVRGYLRAFPTESDRDAFVRADQAEARKRSIGKRDPYQAVTANDLASFEYGYNNESIALWARRGAEAGPDGVGGIACGSSHP